MHVIYKSSYYFSFRVLLESAIYCAVCILVTGLKLPPFWITVSSCSSPWTKILSFKNPSSKIDYVLTTSFVALLVNSGIPPEKISVGLLINSSFLSRVLPRSVWGGIVYVVRDKRESFSISFSFRSSWNLSATMASRHIPLPGYDVPAKIRFRLGSNSLATTLLFLHATYLLNCDKMSDFS